jgi:Tfp pilus assembly protein PilE
MSRLSYYNRGFTLVEVVIAMFLTIVAVLGILALVSPAWKTAARSDYLGRASGILYETLMRQEALIMNPCCIVSGQTAAQAGDAQFNVTTTITLQAANSWLVTVRVSWPPLNATGISESLVVTGQEGFRFPAGCVDRQRTCP